MDMESSVEVYKHIVKISQETSMTNKLALLREMEHSDLFKCILKYVFDSTVVFGIVLKPEEWEPCLREEGSPFTAEVFHYLSLLARNFYTRTEAVKAFQRLAVTMDSCSTRLLVWTINKNIGAGINASTINKAFKGLISVFPYMRCSLPNKVDIDTMEWQAGVYAQEKADGMFVNINVWRDEVELLSRQGTHIPIEKLDGVAEDLAAVLPNFYQVHGEMLIRDSNGQIAPHELGNGLINSLCKTDKPLPKGYGVLFRVWDAVPYKEVVPKGKYTEPYHLRFSRLVTKINDGKKLVEEKTGRKITVVEPITTKIVYSVQEAYRFYRQMLSEGKEGAVLKNPTAIWRDGTSKEQIKLKLECDCDLLVVGFEEGKGKYKGTLGSMSCESREGMLKVNISGFSDSLRKEIWAHRNEYMGKIVTVKFNNVMAKEGECASLFLPRFVEFREDKIVPDTLTRIISAQQQSINFR